MARQGMNLVKEKVALPTPNPQVGEGLYSETIAMVIRFYNPPEISREIAGLKVYVSVNGSDGCHHRKRKHLVLCNLKGAFQNFRNKHRTLKIVFSVCRALT